MLSHGLWMRRFSGARRTCSGRRSNLDQQPHTVIGVLAPDFELFQTADLYVPDWDRGRRRCPTIAAGIPASCRSRG